MGARLFINSVDGRRVEEEVAYPFDQFRVVIGRTAAADVRLPHRTVSERHASLEQQTGAYRLTDNGSTNGTRVNGKALVPHRGRRLQDGDQIDIGVYQLSFHDGVLVTEPLTSERTAELARRLLREQTENGFRRTEPPRVVVVSGPQSGQSTDLPRAPETISIGSAGHCGLVLADGAVEPDHLLLCWTPEGVRAQTNGSEAAFFSVRGYALRGCPLEDGDELIVGDTRLLFEDPAEASLSTLEGDFDQAHSYEGEGTPPGKQGSPKRGRRRGDRNPRPPTPVAQPDPLAMPGERQTTPEHRHAHSLAADLLVFGLAGLMLTLSLAALAFLLRG